LKIGFVALLALLLFGCVSSSRAAGAPNFSGTWNTTYHCKKGWCAGQDFPSNGVVLVQAPGSSTVTNGTGGLVGPVSGRTLTMHGADGSYTFTEVLTLSADGNSYEGPDKDSNGTSGTVTATRVAEKVENSVDGSVYRLVCSEKACHREPPFGPVTVVASSGSDSASATTDAEGKYELTLANGSWRVGPSIAGTTKTSLPKDRVVSFSGEVGGSSSGFDFNVCDERPAPNIPDGCAPVFDYTMPARFDKASLDKAYVTPASFPVDFALQAGCDEHASYTWFVDGKQVADHPGGGVCKFRIDFDKEGTYQVRVDKQVSSGEQASYVSEVVVQDFLIASVGDSLASGEGNPPYTNSKCDTSAKAYGEQVAGKIEELDPRSSVTFMQLACSGATVDSNIAALGHTVKTLQSEGVFGGNPLEGKGKAQAALEQIDAHGRNAIGAQLLTLKEKIGDRQLDALTISIGINNLEFGSIVSDCILRTRCQDPPAKIYGEHTLFTNLGKEVPARIESLQMLLSDLHAAVGDLFPRSQLNPDDVFVVGYPDPLHNQAGELCPVFIGDSDTNAFQNDKGEGEVTWAENVFMTPLENATASFAHGWNYIDTANALSTHGYCSTTSWFNHIDETYNKGGKLDIAGGDNPSGILHPNAEGQSAIVDLLFPRVKSRLFNGSNARKPS